MNVIFFAMFSSLLKLVNFDTENSVLFHRCLVVLVLSPWYAFKLCVSSPCMMVSTKK